MTVKICNFVINYQKRNVIQYSIYRYSSCNVDAKFAQAVGEEYGITSSDDGTSTTTLPFYTPPDYFGPSSAAQRQQEKLVKLNIESPPKT